MNIVEITRGTLPVVLGLPHTGTWIPDDIAGGLNETGHAIADTDWHIEKVFTGLLPGASTVRATFHRYVIDANRPPDGASLYPGQNTTGLCPSTDFDGLPIYKDGAAPDAVKVAHRRQTFHAPYHAAIEAELTRVQAIHGQVLLFDCHSIRSVIPYLFEGTLPDLNIGTNGGVTCAPALEAIMVEAASQSPFTSVLNGRFKGGWTTRHYGAPDKGRHAIQLEIAQSAYMHEAPPWDWDPERAAKLQLTLTRLLARLSEAMLTLSEETR